MGFYPLRAEHLPSFETMTLVAIMLAARVAMGGVRTQSVKCLLVKRGAALMRGAQLKEDGRQGCGRFFK